MSVEERLSALGLALPIAPEPVASYVPAIRTGNLVFSSGQLPMEGGKLTSRGQVGGEVTEEDARRAARIAVLNCLAAIKLVVGDLESIVRVVKLTGYVNSASGFTGQPAVINGASDLLLEIFGTEGKHARASVGAFGLPLGACVEIDLIVEVRSRNYAASFKT